jgi:quercetin dioxygenase-like cupin family protein
MRAFDIAAWRGDFVTVMRRSKRPVTWVDPLGRSNGIALERLIPNALGALLQANIHHIRPGANTDGAIEHEGKEFGYVLEGILRLVVNDIVYTIRRGDSFSFASRIPHKYSKSRKKLHESAFGEYASHFLI